MVWRDGRAELRERFFRRRRAAPAAGPAVQAQACGGGQQQHCGGAGGQQRCGVANGNARAAGAAQLGPLHAEGADCEEAEVDGEEGEEEDGLGPLRQQQQQANLRALLAQESCADARTPAGAGVAATGNGRSCGGDDDSGSGFAGAGAMEAQTDAPHAHHGACVGATNPAYVRAAAVAAAAAEATEGGAAAASGRPDPDSDLGARPSPGPGDAADEWQEVRHVFTIPLGA